MLFLILFFKKKISLKSSFEKSHFDSKNFATRKKFKKLFILTCIASKLSSRPSQAQLGIFPRRNFWFPRWRTCDTGAFCLSMSEFFLGFLLRNLQNKCSMRTTRQALMEQQLAFYLDQLKNNINL